MRSSRYFRWMELSPPWIFQKNKGKAVINNWKPGGRNVNITTDHSLQRSGTYSIGRLIHLLSLTEWVRPATYLSLVICRTDGDRLDMLWRCHPVGGSKNRGVEKDELSTWASWVRYMWSRQHNILMTTRRGGGGGREGGKPSESEKLVGWTPKPPLPTCLGDCHPPTNPSPKVLFEGKQFYVYPPSKRKKKKKKTLCLPPNPRGDS